MGGVKKQTRCKKNIVNPEFEERFAVVIKDQAMLENMLVTVSDKRIFISKNRQIGEVTVSLFDLIHMGANGAGVATIEKEHKVESDQVSCMVGFKMQWFSTVAAK